MAALRRVRMDIVSAILLLFISGCGGPSAQDHQVLAQQALAQQDWPKAAYHLKQSIQLESKQGSTRLQLGLLYLQRFELNNAIKELRIAKSLGVKEALAPLAEAYSWQGQYQEILQLREDSHASPTEQATLLLLKVEAALILEPFAVAKQYLEALSQFGTDSSTWYLAQAYILLAQQQAELALPWLAKALQQDPINQRALWLQAKAQLSLQHYHDSAKTLKRLLAFSPDRVSYYLLAIDAAFAIGELDLAARYIDQVERLDPQQPQHIFNQAYLALQQGRFTQAIVLSDKILLQREDFAARLINGISHYYLSNWEQAYNQFTRTADQLPPDHIVQQLLADVLFKLGHVEESALLAEASNWQAINQLPLLLSLSSGLQQRGQIATSQRLLSRAQQLAQRSSDPQFNVGVIQLLSGELDAGIAALEVAVNEHNASDHGQILLFNAYLAAQKWAQAEQLALALFKQPNRQALSYQMQASLQLSRQQLGVAKETLQRALLAYPERPIFYVLLAQTYLLQRDWLAANSSLQRLLQLQPQHGLGLRMAVLIDLYNQQLSAAIERLSQAQQLGPLSSRNRLLLARLLLFNQQADAALSLLMDFPHKQQASPEWQLLTALSHQRLQHWSQAEQYFTQLVSIQGLTSATLLPLAQVMLAQEQHSELLALLQRYPLLDSANYRALEIRLLIKLQQWPQAKHALQQALLALPAQSTRFLMISMQLALARGETQKAITQLEALIQQAPQVQMILYLAHLYGDREPDKGQALLASGLKVFPEHVLLQQAQAQIWWRQGNRPAARLIWQQILTRYPNDIVALNNAAWAHQQAGEVVQGLTLIELAYQQTPHDPQVLDTYAVLLSDQSQFQQAIGLLERIPPIQRRYEQQLHLARAYYGNNEYDKAQSVLNGLNGSSSNTQQQIEVRALRAMIDASLKPAS